MAFNKLLDSRISYSLGGLAGTIRSLLLAADEGGKLPPTVVAAMYQQHADELRRFLIGVLRDAQLASDVLQIAFTKLMQEGHLTQPEYRKSWLYKVAYNEAIAIRRREAVGNRVVREIANSLPASQPDDVLMKNEAAKRVQDAILQLPLPQQQIVRMRIYERKTFLEIAETLKIPLGTALARMQLALKKLRKTLGDE